MAKVKNMRIQLHQRLDSLLAIGESKHAAKVDYRQRAESQGRPWNPAQSDFIHSIKTADTYRKVVQEFTTWLKAERPEVWGTKDLGQVTKEVAYDYLKSREARGLSPYTISRDMSALNKLLRLELTKKEGGLQERSYTNVTRSRTSKEYGPAWREQILLVRATGCRKESVTKIRPEDAMRCEKTGLVTSVWVKEKGGRERQAYVLPEYRRQLTKLMDSKPQGRAMFKRTNSHMAYHAFRREYAKTLYKQLQKDNPRQTYRGYDKDAVLAVSTALGHNRLDVAIYHYLK